MSKAPFEHSDIDLIRTAINECSTEAQQIAEEHGFKDNTPGEDFALMTSEVSEALEDYRAGKPLNEVWYEQVVSTKVSQHGDFDEIVTVTRRRRTPADGYKPCGAPSELADAVIRIMHFCARHGIDLGESIVEKMQFNATRPYKHGNKKI